MEEKDIRKYATLMRELDLSGLEISENGSNLRLERNSQQGIPVLSAAAAPVPASAALPVLIGADEGETITSPLVGVFYAAATEDGDPFVKAGDSVRRGDVLCIIEAMKLMNEVTAEEDGMITEICVANGQVVDYGRPLFRLKKEER